MQTAHTPGSLPSRSIYARARLGNYEGCYCDGGLTTAKASESGCGYGHMPDALVPLHGSPQKESTLDDHRL